MGNDYLEPAAVRLVTGRLLTPHGERLPGGFGIENLGIDDS